MTKRKALEISWVLWLIVPVCFAQARKQDAAHTGMDHKMVTPDKVVWTQPPTLPPGIKMAVIDGDPKERGLTLYHPSSRDRCPRAPTLAPGR